MLRDIFYKGLAIPRQKENNSAGAKIIQRPSKQWLGCEKWKGRNSLWNPQQQRSSVLFWVSTSLWRLTTHCRAMAWMLKRSWRKRQKSTLIGTVRVPSSFQQGNSLILKKAVLRNRLKSPWWEWNMAHSCILNELRTGAQLKPLISLNVLFGECHKAPLSLSNFWCLLQTHLHCSVLFSSMPFLFLPSESLASFTPAAPILLAMATPVNL